MARHLHKTIEGVLVAVENDWGRRAAESALVTGVLVCGQAVNSLAAAVVDGPSADAVSELLLVANAVVEAGADGRGEASCEGGDHESGELHVGRVGGVDGLRTCEAAG